MKRLICVIFMLLFSINAMGRSYLLKNQRERNRVRNRKDIRRLIDFKKSGVKLHEYLEYLEEQCQLDIEEFNHEALDTSFLRSQALMSDCQNIIRDIEYSEKNLEEILEESISDILSIFETQEREVMIDEIKESIEDLDSAFYVYAHGLHSEDF